jgi:hypothetical protein
LVREAGKLYTVFVRRARCGRCGVGESLLPDFVLARRRDTTAAVGAAVLAPAGARSELAHPASRPRDRGVLTGRALSRG